MHEKGENDLRCSNPLKQERGNLAVVEALKSDRWDKKLKAAYRHEQ
jgi:hypothetical protein